MARINHSGKFHMIPSMVRGKYVIRFCVTYEHATEEHIGELNSYILFFFRILRLFYIKIHSQKTSRFYDEFYFEFKECVPFSF